MLNSLFVEFLVNVFNSFPNVIDKYFLRITGFIPPINPGIDISKTSKSYLTLLRHNQRTCNRFSIVVFGGAIQFSKKEEIEFDGGYIRAGSRINEFSSSFLDSREARSYRKFS